MDAKPSIPVVVHVDDPDEPADVLDVLALEGFIAGSHPVAKTVTLTRVRADVSFAPGAAISRRVAEARWRTVVLYEGDGWTLKATRWQDNKATVTVTACSGDVADAILSEVTADYAEAPVDNDTALAVGFWHLGRHGGHRSVRTVEGHSWSSLRRNYNAAAAGLLDTVMGLSAAKLTGRLLLLHGPPGTGKTSAVRALGHEWGEWCQLEYILDPEQLLNDAGYLTSVLLGDDDEEHGADSWRLLVLEDCDEVIRANAKSDAGQSLGRLLNLTDGLLGQGRNVLVCITTNEDVSRFHPAVVRPGRCLAQIEIGPLSRGEAADWLGVDPADWPAGASLAELFAARNGHPVLAVPSQQPPIGQYL